MKSLRKIFLAAAVILFLVSELFSSPFLAPHFHLGEPPAGSPDAFYNRFEKGFTKFSLWLLRMFKKHEKRIRPETLKALKEPLELFLENRRSNPLRDYRLFLRKQRVAGLKGPIYYFRNNNHFYYSVLPAKYRRFAAAGFVMSRRVMLINPEYNPDSIFDNLVVFHELVHALQDTTLRNHLAKKGKAGLRLLSQYILSLKRRRKDPDLEPVAYAMELELLNILLMGKLRVLIRNRQPLPMRQIVKLLGVTTRSKLGSLRVLLKYGLYYFGDRCWIYSYTRRYRAVILRDHMKLGMRFIASENRFIRGADGGR